MRDEQEIKEEMARLRAQVTNYWEVSVLLRTIAVIGWVVAIILFIYCVWLGA